MEPLLLLLGDGGWNHTGPITAIPEKAFSYGESTKGTALLQSFFGNDLSISFSFSLFYLRFAMIF